jgi:flavin-dependent dehydrogenase
MDDYDLIIVGGGLAGLSLALVMSREGSRVLILEKSRR